MTAFAYIALGAGLMLVADIMLTGWKSRSDEAQARRSSLEALRGLPAGRTRSEAIAATFTAAPRVMTDGEVRRINRKLRRNA